MSSSSSRRKFHLRHPAVVDMGCNCRRPKLSFLFSSSHSYSKPKTSHGPFSPSTTTTTTAAAAFTSSPDPRDPYFATTTAASSSPSEEDPPPPPPPPPPPETMRRRKGGKKKKKKKGTRRVLEEESVAVVKESSEPYADFRDSMVEMIVEREMYGWDDLGDLLAQFLALNSPRHHQLILRVFADLWTEATAVSSPPPA